MQPSETGDGTVAQEALDQSDVVGVALCYMTSAMLTTSYTLAENSQLYTLKVEELRHWLLIPKCHLKRAMIPLVFRNVPVRLMEVLRRTRPQPPTAQVMGTDENEILSLER